MDQEKKATLQELLNNGKDWEKLDLGNGAFIVKMPPKGHYPAKLAMILNPLNADGKPKKRKGLFVTDAESFTAFQTLFSNAKLLDAMQTLDEINESAPINKLDL